MWNEKFDKYIGRSDRFQDTASSDPENSVKILASDIGRNVGFNRIAVHHVVLPPHCRTSYPHAESMEEEFALVLKGAPDLWLNGYIHQLKEGHAVGFPSGTGIAHTFINNTDSDIHLLVAGEKTKAKNHCSFPINPELKEACKIWWEGAPPQAFGPHNGLPGTIKDFEKAVRSPGCIVFCPEIERGKVFHYPGDNETFGNGFRITDKVGLKVLGIWYEYLRPGRRSAFPHAHTHEDEFIYVVKGKLTIWMDGFCKQIDEGDFAAFPSNTGIAHTVINDSDDDIIYLCIGEALEFPDERITYPLNPLRNQECMRKGSFWHNAPKGEPGPHNGRPRIAFDDHLSFRLCSEQNADEVLDIFKCTPDYFLKVDGCLPNKKIARSAIVDCPKAKGKEFFKEFLIVELNGDPVGVLDVHVHHPEDGICYLGLLLIKEALFGNGLGARCYRLGEDYIKRALGCKKIRLGISDENDASGFWRKMGFLPNGKTYIWEGESKSSRVQEFEKVLV